MQITIPMAPMGKPRMTQSDKWKRRDVVQEYWSFKDALIFHFGAAGYDLAEMDIYEIHLSVGVPMYKSWPKVKIQKRLGQPCRGKPDFDNIEKAVADAICLNNKGKGDDSGVWKSSLEKVWTYVDEGYMRIKLRFEYL